MAMKMRPSRAKLTVAGSEVSRVELCAGQALEDVEVPSAGGAHHLGRQGGRRRLPVPSACTALSIEVVTQRLLVEARLRSAGAVGVRRPEPRAVGGEHLI